MGRLQFGSLVFDSIFKGSITEQETRLSVAQKLINKDRHNDNDKWTGSIHFGSLNLVGIEEGSSSGLKKKRKDGLIKYLGCVLRIVKLNCKKAKM